MDEIENPSSTGLLTNVLLAIELFLLTPWLVFTLFAPMAFDAGHSYKTYAFVWSIYTYPITLTAALVLRKKYALLPLLNIAVFSGVLPK